MVKIKIDQAKTILQCKKAELQKILDSIRAQDPSNMPGWEDENTQDDDAFERESKSRVDALEKRTLEIFANVNRSLEKIENKTYGVCDACGKEIDPARLKMIPEASYCIYCQRNVE